MNAHYDIRHVTGRREPDELLVLRLRNVAQDFGLHAGEEVLRDKEGDVDRAVLNQLGCHSTQWARVS